MGEKGEAQYTLLATYKIGQIKSNAQILRLCIRRQVTPLVGPRSSESGDSDEKYENAQNTAL